MCSRERERERRRRRDGGKRDHEERRREEQSFGATAIASLVTAIALLEQSFGATSFAARFVFTSPSSRRRPANKANGAVSPLPPTGALAPLPPTIQFQELNCIAGVDNNCSYVKADVMNMPFSDNSFDAIFAIEATCHAPDVVDCYKEIFEVLKPGQCFAAYEWFITNSFDPNNEEHQRIKVLLIQYAF